MTDSELIQSILTGVLVIITGVYVWRTFVISRNAQKQAEASVRMVNEMREQRVTLSRPIVIPRPVHGPDFPEGRPVERFQWFEVYNAGNGPAVNLEVLLLNGEKAMRELQLQPFLRAGEHITFIPANLSEYLNSACYVMCRYESVVSRTEPRQWYETWVSFKPQVSQRGDYIFVVSEETEFKESLTKVSY